MIETFQISTGMFSIDYGRSYRTIELTFEHETRPEKKTAIELIEEFPLMPKGYANTAIIRRP